MASNTTFDPQNLSAFEKTKLFKDAKGVAITATAGEDTTLDLTLDDDTLLSGGTVFLAKGAAPGDTVDFKVVHPTAGVIAQFITDWFVNPDSTLQQVPESNYPAKVFAGLTLRVVYHSVGSTDVWIAVNYNKEKILV